MTTGGKEKEERVTGKRLEKEAKIEEELAFEKGNECSICFLIEKNYVIEQ